MARGTFKQRRGGGRSFSKNLVLDENGTAVSTDKWVARGKKIEEEDDGDGGDDDEEEEESDEEEEEEEEESGDDAPAAASSNAKQPELSRAERRQLKKQKGGAKQQKQDGEEDEEEEDPLFVNPNQTVGKKMNISDLSAPRQLSRREREEIEKKDAQERYWKLHAAGKTDQAKADLARLAKIRKEREEAQARRKAEAEAKAKEFEEKKKTSGARAKR